MENLILINLKEKLAGLKARGVAENEVLRNAVKEELQLYVLDFIYHHPQYSEWIMYGGSALRICHQLDRMSVDLDFEVKDDVTDEYLESLKEELLLYFGETYQVKKDLIDAKVMRNRGVVLRFLGIAKELGLSAMAEEKIHVRIDLNKLPKELDDKVVTERIPINRAQLSFVIKTYNMSALMASKIVAVFQRGPRGVGKSSYAHKGRDIYDLLWYMDKQVVPDLDYLSVKGEKSKDVRELFNRLVLEMNNVNDTNLRNDLSPLFTNQKKIQDWLENWRESFQKLYDSYTLLKVKDLVEIKVLPDSHGHLLDVFFFTYTYETGEGVNISVVYRLGYHWLVDPAGEINVDIIPKVESLIDTETSKVKINERVLRYASLFYKKTEEYFKKSNRVAIGRRIATRLIRSTTEDLNPVDDIFLPKSALLDCELEDLLK